MDRSQFLVTLGVFCVLLLLLVWQLYRMPWYPVTISTRTEGTVSLGGDDDAYDDYGIDGVETDIESSLERFRRLSYETRREFYRLSYTAHLAHGDLVEDEEGYMYD